MGQVPTIMNCNPGPAIGCLITATNAYAHGYRLKGVPGLEERARTWMVAGDLWLVAGQTQDVNDWEKAAEVTKKVRETAAAARQKAGEKLGSEATE